MLGRDSRLAVACASALATFAVAAGDASATTFCVPGFSSSCPNSGGNVAEADLEEAMSLQGADGKADEIRLTAGTFTESGAPAYRPAAAAKPWSRPAATRWRSSVPGRARV